MSVASAANVTLKTTDAAGTSSFNGATNWSNGAVPSSGNTYETLAYAIRTTNTTTSGLTFNFAGASLSIDTGGRLLGKIGNNNTSTTGTINGNFILNGGYLDQAGGVGDNAVMIVSGTVVVNAASGLGAFGATSSGSAAFETLNFAAPISGSAALQVSGANVNAGNDTGVVVLGAANPYGGTITVTNANGKIVASLVNRILQLNNLNALSNATVNLVAAATNPVSFASAVNTASFNVGGLAGNSSQALSDTAGNAVALSVGGNNTSSTFGGSLTGYGSLVKAGMGTLTLTGVETYTGATTISNGTLALGAGAVFASTTNIIVSPAGTFDVSSNAFALAAGQSLLGGGMVKGVCTVASGASVYAGLDAAYGTNTFATNLIFSTGANVDMDLGAAYNGANDLIVVGGNLTLSNTAFNIKAPSTSDNLDQTADYILMSVAGTINGNPNITPAWVAAPQNANHYSIQKSGTNIVLHYNTSLLPSGYGSASPNPAVRNQSVLVTVTVTYSATAVSSVTVDATALGGSSSVPLVSAGSGTYTNTVVVGPGISPGDQALTATITDSTSPTPLSVTTPVFTETVSVSSDVWSGGGADNNWSSNPNWQSGSAPGYAGDALTFAGTTRLAPDMNANYSVTSLTFDGTAGGFVLNSSGGYVLSLSGGINDNSSTSQTINLSITNTGNTFGITGNNNMAINGGITGQGGLADNVSGTLMLGGTNSFVGGINIASGTLQIGGAGLLGGTNGIYGGNITNAGVFQYSSSATQTLSGVASSYGTVIKDGTGKLILAGNNTYYAATYISNGVLQVTGTLANDIGNTFVYDILNNGTLEMSGSTNQTLSGVISGTGALIQDGPGTLNINGANNTYTGATFANGGTLVYSPASIGYSTPVSALIINGGGTVTVNVSSSAALAAGSLALNTNGILNLNYSFSGGNPSVPALAVSGSVSASGTSTIRVSGYGVAAGQFPLISYGTLAASLSDFILDLPPGVTAVLVDDSANKSIDLNVTASSPATWIPLTATDTLGNSSFTNGNNWQNSTLPTAGTGYYTQGYVLRSPADANACTFGGSALSIDAYQLGGGVGGRLLLKGPGGAVITVTNLILNGGLMDYANAADGGTETFAGSILLNAGTTSYIGALTSETFIITAPFSGAGNLQVGGVNVNGGADTSVVAVYGTNSYTGTTTIATGTLLVNGPAANTAVTVLTNATLGGLGSIGGVVTVLPGGTLAPGIGTHGTLTNTIGTLTAGGAVSVSGSVVMKINRAASPNSDSVAAPSSSITINTGATLTVNNIGSTNLVAGDVFTLFSAPVNGFFSVTNLPALPSASLAWTNNLALNGTIAVISTASSPAGPGVLTNSYIAAQGSLSLSWPTNQGWRLQMQTNSLASGLGTNWTYLSDGKISGTNITIDPSKPAVFYRLTYP